MLGSFRVRPMTYAFALGGAIAGAWLFEGIWPILIGLGVGVVIGSIIDHRNPQSAG